MDTSDPEIRFDADGVCNHCRLCDLIAARGGGIAPDGDPRALEEMVATLRAAGRGRDYDCVIGLSGGVDSSYLAYLVVRELGLRPLAVHLDNGWNSQIATSNIQRIVRKLDVDLITHVIDWEEFRDLQRAYFLASVIDIEGTTDHAIRAVLYNAAEQHGIRHILSGTNGATEMILPHRWGFHNNDVINLRAIHRRYGTRPLTTFPLLGGARLRELTRKGITTMAPLDVVRYVKTEAKAVLIEQLGWIDYRGKHAESLFTKWYQGYFLVEKFGFDKRRAHLASLINSGQITRDEALAELAAPPYPVDEMDQDTEYVIKKLGWTRDEFRKIMALPPRSNFAFPTELDSKMFHLVQPRLLPIVRRLRQVMERALPAPVVRELKRRVQRLLPR